MSTKQKLVVITIEEKLEPIKIIQNVEILRTLIADFGVGVSTVSDWVKIKNKFEEHALKMPKKKTMKSCQNEKVNEAEFLWFTQQRDDGDDHIAESISHDTTDEVRVVILG